MNKYHSLYLVCTAFLCEYDFQQITQVYLPPVMGILSIIGACAGVVIYPPKIIIEISPLYFLRHRKWFCKDYIFVDIIFISLHLLLVSLFVFLLF